MNKTHTTGFILSLALVFSLPLNASADEVAVAAEQPALQRLDSMQDMMREMRRDREPSKCKTLKDATDGSAASAPAEMPAMGMGMMGMMGMGPGKGENCKTGGMQGEGKKPCMQGQHKNCNMRGGNDDQRLDMLEKRMDMMQMMMQMMMRSGARN